MPKATTVAERHAPRHNPLADDLVAQDHLRTKSGKRKSRDGENSTNDYIDSKSSRRILQLGQDLADEEAAENSVVQPSTAFDFESRFGGHGENEEENGGEYDDDEQWGDEDDIVEAVEVDPQDADMFNRFFPTSRDPIFETDRAAEKEAEGQGTNLADLILEKIAAHEEQQAGGFDVQGGGPPEDAIELPAKVVDVYQKYVCIKLITTSSMSFMLILPLLELA